MSSCGKCGNRAELLCSRCFDPYCSVSCHLKDWPEHRFACKPIPGLIKIDALVELKNGMASKMPNSEKNVAIEEETRPRATEARPNVLKEQNSPMPALVKNANRMASPQVVTPPITPKQKQSPHGRQAAAAEAVEYIEEEEKPITPRQVKQSPHGRQAAAAAVEYIEEQKPVTPRQVKQSPHGRQAAAAAVEYIEEEKPVTPRQVKQSPHGRQAAAAADEYIEEQKPVTPKQVKQSPNARQAAAAAASAAADSEEDLSDRISSKPGLVISEQKVARSSNPEEEDTLKGPRNVPPKFIKLRPLKQETLKPVKRYFMQELDVVPIREGKNVTLFITDTSLVKESVIGALDNGNKARFDMDENVKKLAEYCAVAAKNNPGYEPELNELCLAVFHEDKEWYRAFVIEKKDEKNKYSVQFVDYGNIADVASSEIMPMTEELMFPTCTNLCLITNVKERDLVKLQAYLGGSTTLQGDVKYNNKTDLYEIEIDTDAILK